MVNRDSIVPRPHPLKFLFELGLCRHLPPHQLTGVMSHSVHPTMTLSILITFPCPVHRSIPRPVRIQSK